MNDKERAEAKVGMIVYKGFRPALYGKVLEIDPEREIGRGYRHMAFRIRWKDGTENWEFHHEVRSLETLIADHERKLQTHRATLLKAQAL